MFDATDLEIARREHSYEMGAETKFDRSWSRWYDSAEAAIRSKGWVRHGGSPDSEHDTGLDGNEYTDGGEPSDGYSIDGAYEAWERGVSVASYIAACEARRARMGLA